MRAEFGASTLVTLVSALVLNGCLWNAVVVSDTIGKSIKMTQLNVDVRNGVKSIAHLANKTENNNFTMGITKKE
jgi:hypothetical protein